MYESTCPECGRQFKSRDFKVVNRLLRLHVEKAHNKKTTKESVVIPSLGTDQASGQGTNTPIRISTNYKMPTL